MFGCHGWYHLSCWSLGVGSSRRVELDVRRRPHTEFLLARDFPVYPRHICLMRAPLLCSSCLAVSAAFMASVQYRWVSKCEEVRSVKLTSKRNWQLSGTLLGLRSESSVISCKRSSNCLLRRYHCCLSCKEMLR